VKILIAEDNRKVATFIQKGLQEEGHAADVVYSGTEVDSQALSFDYDAVILDLMLPDRPGLDILRDIRSQKPRLPVLVLTAKGSLEDRVKAWIRERTTTWRNLSRSWSFRREYAPCSAAGFNLIVECALETSNSTQARTKSAALGKRSS
jgi:CheY-like chemotaxis protein